MVRLRTAGLSSEYRRNRRDSGVWFLNYVAGLGKRLDNRCGPQEVDCWLEKGVQSAYEDGFRLYQVTLGILALQQKFRLSTALLRNTWAAVRGWRSLLPSKTRVPITEFRVECAVIWAMACGVAAEGLQRREWIACAIGWWLCFSCLLRPGEVLNLRRGDINLPEGDGDAEGSPLVAVVIIRKPKTRRIWREQFVLCNDGRLVGWLKWWLDGVPNSRLLVGVSRYIFADRFNRIMTHLGLEECHYTLSSMRAGGATSHFQKHQNLGALQFLGRWSAASTLQHYLMEAFSAHVTFQASSVIRRKLEMVHRHVSALDSPPVLGARVFLRSQWS